MFNWKKIWDKRGRSKDSINETVGWNGVPIDLEKVTKEIVTLLKIKPEDKVLEIGSGSGSLAIYLEPQCQYTGLDYSKSMIQKHLKNIPSCVILSEANNLPFKDKYFDKSFVFSVFHYFPDKAYAFDVLTELKRVTKGGIYIGDIPVKSHRKEHLIYSKSDFNGGKFTKGFYTKDRFNVIYPSDKRTTQKLYSREEYYYG